MRTHRTFGFARYIPLLALLVAACDVTAPITESVLTVRFVQSRQVGTDIEEVAELGRFTLSAPETLPRASMFTQSVTLEGFQSDRHGLRQTGSSSDRSEDVIFWYITDDATQEVVASSVEYFYDVSDLIPKPLQPSPAAKREDVFRGTLHVFNIEGIGTPSRLPIELTFYGVSEERTFTYAPQDHVLPPRFVLRIDEADLRSYLPETVAPLFSVKMESEALDLDRYVFMHAEQTTVGVQGRVNGTPFTSSMRMWDGRALLNEPDPSEDSSVRRAVTWLGVPEDLEFYLIALEKP